MNKILLTSLLYLSIIFGKELVIVVSFDGFRYDYLDFVQTEHFDSIKKDGSYAESLIPVFPSLTFPNHYSIATGAYANKHNITGNTFYNKSTNSTYSLKDRFSVENKDFYYSEPIWVTAEKQNIKSAIFFWIGSEAPINNIRPSIYKNYDGSVPYKARIDSAIKWIQMPKLDAPNFVMLYFDEPDHSGHDYGPSSLEVIEKIKLCDNTLGYLINNLKKINRWNSTNLIVLSDHGMESVDLNKLIIIDDYFDYLNPSNFEGSGAIMQIRLNDNQIKYYDDIYNTLIEIRYLNAYTKKTIPKRYNFINFNTADFIIVANPGAFLTTQTILKKKSITLKGMHGYDPNYKNMHSIFIAHGPNIKRGIVIPSFENIHIYPFLCKLLNIEPYFNLVDGPDGKIEVLETIIK